MKKLCIISISLFTLVACTKDIEQFNEQTKNAAVAPAATLFSNGVKNLMDGLASPNVYGNCAKVSDKVIDPAAPALLLDYVEIEFYKAEAKERGFNISGTAEDHYKNAVKASIVYWGGTTAQADSYLQTADVAYAIATGNYKQKIGTQKWIALFNRGFEGWTEYRRMDFPALTQPSTARSGYPARFTYPTNEQTLNKSNYTGAAAKIGGDKVESKIFWDKY